MSNDRVSNAARSGTIVWVTEHINKGAVHGIGSLTESGFCVNIEGLERDEPWEGDGTITGYPVYAEYQNVERLEEELIESGNLEWGKEIRINLDGVDNKGFVAKFTLYNGEELYAEGDRAEFGLLTVIHNRTQKSVILSPVSAVDAELR